MSIETALRSHGAKMFWWPVAGTIQRSNRRWVEVYWLRFNLSILISR